MGPALVPSSPSSRICIFRRFSSAYALGSSPPTKKNPLPTKIHHVDEILRSEPLRQAFSEHLRQEYSMENLEFMSACHDLRQCKSIAAKRAKALFIYRHFIGPTSERQINISSTLSKAISDEVLSFHAFGASAEHLERLFAQAEHEVRFMLELDSLPRFIRSDRYRRLSC